MQDRNAAAITRVLIVDDDLNLARAAANNLTEAGYSCEICPNAETALKILDQEGAEVIVADMRLPGMGGVEFLAKVREKRPDVAVVVSVPSPATEGGKEAVRRGAFDYVIKPFDKHELGAAVSRAVEVGSLQRENRRLREQLDVASMAAGFIAESPATKALVSMVRRVAPSHSTALIEGETGTGKELVARMLHYWSDRAAGPFVAINCKAFADGVVESELFGHERGSFTGAIRDRAGCFERASGGTLFLDEIAEAGSDFQAKLLRVLEDGEVLRVGASKARKVDVRIIAATNRKLRAEVGAGRFRGDLYFRLNVIPVHIPPLRERPEDILPIANHFLALHAAELGRPFSLAPDAERALLRYSWPGNVRELENVIERAVVMSGAEVLTPDAFALDYERPIGESRMDEGAGGPEPDEMAAAAHALDNHAGPTEGTLQDCLDRAATVRIKAALAATNDNRIEAAAALGVDRTTLYRLMKRLGL
jgi:DNA-binding NtrC family response regulator